MNNEIQIIKAIAEHLGLVPADLDRHASLRDDLNLGPIETNDLLTQLAGEFNITFDADQVEDLQTIGDLIVLIEDNLID